MENKFILVPSDLYKNLFKKDTGELNPENAKKDLTKILQKVKIDKTTQNALYNQQLKRYLKLKHEFENKPIKVELSNGSKLFLKLEDMLKQRKNKKVKGLLVKPSDNSKGDDYDMDSVGSGNTDDFFDNLFKTENETKDEKYETPKKDNEENDDIDGDESTLKEEDLEPDIVGTSESKIITEKTNENTKSKLIELVKNNKNRFGITNSGKILKSNGHPISNSNMEKAIDRLFDKSALKSPPGTATLQARLKKDNEANKILSTINTTPKRPMTRSKHRETQSGKGILKRKNDRIIIISNKHKCRKHKNKKKKFYFKPQKWQ